MISLTEQEKTFLNELNFVHIELDFKTESLVDREYIETTGDGEEYCRYSALGARKARGVLSSLMQKGVLEYFGNLPENRDCWNPIYKGENYDEAIMMARMA